jgi:biotin carboxyl carrier protein
MKAMPRTAAAAAALVLMLLIDVSPQLFYPRSQPFYPGFQLVPDAHAILGVRRRTRRRTAVVVGTTVHAADSAQIAQSQQQAAAAQQQAAAAQQQAAAAQQQTAAAKQEAADAKKEAAAAKQAAVAAPPPAVAAGAPLPLGTVVAALPGGCTSTPVGGVQYYYCGGNFYRAMFQGNTLVYVTAKP